MRANAQDLPEELIARIVRLLSGERPETWDRYSHSSPPLRLSKRQLGRCALTCRFWAIILRPEIFRKLVLRTAEDGRMFRAIIESPVDVNLAIAPLVGYIRIECDLGEQPWVHLVFMSGAKLVNIDEIHLSVSYSSGTSSPPIRSIHHSLPHALPVWLPRVQTLYLDGLSFADFSSINRFIRSVDRHRADITLENLHIDDVETCAVIGLQRSWTSEYPTIYVKDWGPPLTLLRALVSTRPRLSSLHPPYVQQRVLSTLEKVLLPIMQTCPVVRDWSFPGANGRAENDETHQHLRELSFAMHEDAYHNTHVKIESWCDGGIIKRAVANIREDGSLRSFHIGVNDCRRAIFIPWAELDEHFWALAEGMQCLDFCVEQLERDSFADAVRESMPHFAQTGKLQFRTFDRHGRLTLFEKSQTLQ